MDLEETLGITLPVRTWKELFVLSGNADRLPSDYLRQLINREAGKLATPEQGPAAIGPNLEAAFA